MAGEGYISLGLSVETAGWRAGEGGDVSRSRAEQKQDLFGELRVVGD